MTTGTPRSVADAAGDTDAHGRAADVLAAGQALPRARRLHLRADVRASVNGSGGPLSYDAAHHRWNGYCTAVGLDIEIHHLRHAHAHATELINSGVSIEVVRRRLGHASTETTQIYILLADQVADADIRAARRRRERAG
ncbi:tyrosine-type recombinase/integrase [Amycolatopsis carbonis]|uniref:Tyrosine-type recombinase/integrase n=1 Tax=Amycolatopsis carbonis TaxID=715471 RepID=A0A9Y2IP08_9PSEU|nr:tyrosine-type recombinase/integrase [Amycolatopsis sp. 2-15]WIX83342.1 tyrosine-type recombinase/integrase [Amycolatopsis sp. 2-15]